MVQIQIAHGRRVRGYSVRLDPSTKSKIRHYLEKIREIVDRLEVPLPKKEALSARITALSDEVDRDRTRFDAYAGLALEMAATGGEVAQRLNPVRRFLDSIAGLLGYAKQAETRGLACPLPTSENASRHPGRNGCPRRSRATLAVPGTDVTRQFFVHGDGTCLAIIRGRGYA